MFLEVLVWIEVPPFTAEIYSRTLSVAVLVARAVPARVRVIKVWVILQTRHVPVDAGLGDGTDPLGEEAVCPVKTRAQLW